MGRCNFGIPGFILRHEIRESLTKHNFRWLYLGRWFSFLIFYKIFREYRIYKYKKMICRGLTDFENVRMNNNLVT
jgi:hypothetical protein